MLNQSIPCFYKYTRGELGHNVWCRTIWVGCNLDLNKNGIQQRGGEGVALACATLYQPQELNSQPSNNMCSFSV